MAGPRRWIRLDVSWESTWLDALSGAAAGCWPRLLCLVKRDGAKGRCKRPRTETLARHWRVDPAHVLELEAAAIADKALRVVEGDWVVVNWDEYQESDPTAAKRKREQRERESVTEPVTPSRHVTRDNRDYYRDPSRDHRQGEGQQQGETENQHPVVPPVPDTPREQRLDVQSIERQKARARAGEIVHRIFHLNQDAVTVGTYTETIEVALARWDAWINEGHDPDDTNEELALVRHVSNFQPDHPITVSLYFGLHRYETRELCRHERLKRAHPDRAPLEIVRQLTEAFTVPGGGHAA